VGGKRKKKKADGKHKGSTEVLHTDANIQKAIKTSKIVRPEKKLKEKRKEDKKKVSSQKNND